MGNDIRKGNRSSIPSRGGMRRSNTPPPPSVRLGIDGLPEVEPISTSRPRGNELPKGVPTLDNLPAEPPPPAPEVVVAKAPPPEVVVAKAPPPEVVVAKAKTPPPEPVAPPPEPSEPVPSPSVPPDAETSGGVSPSIAPRRSVAPGNRKRGSNLKGAVGKSMPPPPSQPLAVQPDEVSTAKAPPVAHAATHVSEPTNGHSSGHATEPEVHAHDEHAHEDRAPVSRPLSAPPPADLDEGFFDHGERAAADAHREAADLENYDEKMAQKNSPEARARRAKNWRYVLFAGAACVLLLLIADVKNRSSRGDSPAVEAPVVVNVAPPSAVPPKVEPTPVAVVVPPASSADEAVVVAPAASGSAQAAGAASGAPADSKWVATTASAAAPGTPPGTPPGPPPGATPPAAAAAEPTAEDRKSAAQEKRTAQSFLDQGAFAKAVEAGEHSVALDPADGEAWLLLGAAYQSMGKGAEARRTFTSCVAEGKRGPINECRAMLR